jgi:hypothetical protein
MVETDSYATSEIEYNTVRYTPKFQTSIDLKNYCCAGIETAYNKFDSLRYLERFCSGSNYSLSYRHLFLSEENTNQRNDIDLLVTFNHNPTLITIELIKHLYGWHFRNIIFCGNKALSWFLHKEQGQFKRFDSYTFIDLINTHSGYYHYYCMTKTIEMGFNTKGILLMSDDVLLKFWQLTKFDAEKIWFPERINTGTSIKKLKDWLHWAGNEKNVAKLFELINRVADGRNNSWTGYLLLINFPLVNNYL